MGFLSFTPDNMTEKEATEILKQHGDAYFDYLKGRVMKINLKIGNVPDTWLYNRDNGVGAAERAMAGLI